MTVVKSVTGVKVTTIHSPSSETRTVVNLMREDGVLIGVEGAYHNVLKIRPPLVFGPPHVKQFVSTLERALATVQ